MDKTQEIIKELDSYVDDIGFYPERQLKDGFRRLIKRLKQELSKSKATEIIDRPWTIRIEMVAENDTTECDVGGGVKSKAQQHLEECIDEWAKLEG